MKRLYWMPVLAASMLLGACASTVKPAYVSPTSTSRSIASSCRQSTTVSSSILIMACRHQNVQVWAGVGLGGGWGKGGWGFGPSISVNMGQSMNTKNTEFANVLGQQDAIVQAARFWVVQLL